MDHSLITTSLGILSILVVFCSASIFTGLFKLDSIHLKGLVFWNIACAEILLIGFALSSFGLLGSIEAWGLGALCFLVIGAFFPTVYRGLVRLTFFKSILTSIAALRSEIEKESKLVIWPFMGLICVFLMVTLYHILICFLLPPTNHDSITYILPRMAHYIQQGSLEYYFSNFIAQTVHFKNATLLQIYIYLASGRNENWIQLINLFSSWAAMLGVYGVSLILWKRKLSALFSALIFGTFTSVLMIAVTPQTDMPITGFLASGLCLILVFSKTGQLRYLSMGIVSVSIALGIKASAMLTVPGLALIVCFSIYVVSKARTDFSWRRTISVLLISTIVAAALFMFPSGYGDNWNRYGHIMGPEPWRKAHTMESVPSELRLDEGTRNFARYVVSFCSLDGLPGGWALQPQKYLRKPLDFLFSDLLNIDIHSTEYTRIPFPFDSYPCSNEDLSYWGISALWFIVPAFFLSLYRSRKRPLWPLLLMTAGLCYFMAQSYLSLYDPWRGRSFMNLGIFLAPLAGVFVLPTTFKALNWKMFRNGYLGAGIVLVCLSTLYAGFFRYSSPIFSAGNGLSFQKGSIFAEKDRMRQITRSNKIFHDQFQAFEESVPSLATVAVDPQVSAVYNYLLYGKSLTRTILFTENQQIPPQADYLLFTDKNRTIEPYDIALNKGVNPIQEGHWYVRKLR